MSEDLPILQYRVIGNHPYRVRGVNKRFKPGARNRIYSTGTTELHHTYSRVKAYEFANTLNRLHGLPLHEPKPLKQDPYRKDLRSGLAVPPRRALEDAPDAEVSESL